MAKTIEKIVISADGIDVISNVNGVNSVTQLNLEGKDNEEREIFEKYNLSSLITYPLDMKIVRALAENEDQLRDYLETCRRSGYSRGKTDIPETIPQIEYDLKNLKAGFEQIKDEDSRKFKQLKMYQDAKKTQDTFKSSKGRVELKMGILDKAYFAIQELLSERNKAKTQTLSAGKDNIRRSIREELRDETLTEKTNQVSKEFAMQTEATVLSQEKEDEIQEVE